MEERKIRERSRWIDAARAAAVLFVLLAHAGVFIPYISGYASAFYVPVFFVLSGYLHRVRRESFGGFVKRRAKRLLAPYFGFSVFLYLCYLLQMTLTAGLDRDTVCGPLPGILYSRAYISPPALTDSALCPLMTVWNSPMWFLTALFTAELLFEALLRAAGEDMKRLCLCAAVCFGAGALVRYFCPVLLPWSADSALLFQVYLTAGYAAKRFGLMERWKEKPWETVLLFGLTAAGNRINGTINPSVGDFGLSAAAGLAVSAGASLVVMQLSFRLCERGGRLAAAVGRSTLPIMCLHMFVFMFARAGALFVFPELMKSPAGTAAAGMIEVLAALSLITAGNMLYEGAKKCHCRRSGMKGSM